MEKEKSQNIFRQGDVYLHRVDSQAVDVNNPISKEERGVVLAHGEVTGHAHVLEDPDAGRLFPVPQELIEGAPGAMRQRLEASNPRILRVTRPTNLVHEEHEKIHLEPGDYFIGIQTEYDEAGAWRRVAD